MELRGKVAGGWRLGKIGNFFSFTYLAFYRSNAYIVFEGNMKKNFHKSFFFQTPVDFCIMAHLALRFSCTLLPSLLD